MAITTTLRGRHPEPHHGEQLWRRLLLSIIPFLGTTDVSQTQGEVYRKRVRSCTSACAYSGRQRRSATGELRLKVWYRLRWQDDRLKRTLISSAALSIQMRATSLSDSESTEIWVPEYAACPLPPARPGS